MGASATKHLFQRLSTALATASSQHTLSIILNTFPFPPTHAILPPYYLSSSPISPFPSLRIYLRLKNVVVNPWPHYSENIEGMHATAQSPPPPYTHSWIYTQYCVARHPVIPIYSVPCWSQTSSVALAVCMHDSSTPLLPYQYWTSPNSPIWHVVKNYSPPSLPAICMHSNSICNTLLLTFVWKDIIYANYIYSIFNIHQYSSAPCAVHTRTCCPMQHYTYSETLGHW